MNGQLFPIVKRRALPPDTRRTVSGVRTSQRCARFARRVTLAVITVIASLRPLLFLAPPLSAQTASTWQTRVVARPIPHDRSRAQVEQELLQAARVALIGESGGSRVSSIQSLLQRSGGDSGESRTAAESLMSLVSVQAEGRIIEERAPLFLEVDSLGQRWLSLTLRARVALETEVADPAFSGSIAVNRPTYREGDSIDLRVSSTRNARAYVLAVESARVVRLVWPNQLDSLNSIPAGATIDIPGNSRNRYALVAELPPGQSSPSHEAVYLVLYRGDNSLFAPKDAFTRTFTLPEIARLVMAVPRPLRSEHWDMYVIEGARANRPR